MNEAVPMATGSPASSVRSTSLTTTDRPALMRRATAWTVPDAGACP